MRFGRRPLRNRSQVHRCVFVVINFSFYIPGIRVQVGERTEDFQQIIDFQSFENPNLVNSYVVTPITECIDIIQDSGHGGRHQLKNE